MSDPLIINARHHLRWHQRLFSDATTAMLWGAWLWLWRPLLGTLSWLGSMGASFQPALLKLVGTGSPINFENPVMALAGASSTLLLWNLLPAHKADPRQAPTLRDYARHFDLAEKDIIDGRASAVCVVHHDEHGRIIRIEARA